MFSRACVKNSVHRGCVCVSQHAMGQTPLGVYPSMHRGRHPPGVYPSMHWGRHPPAASAADGTHPTGMLSCFNAVNSSQGVNY